MYHLPPLRGLIAVSVSNVPSQLDISITPPTLSLAVDYAVYPPQLDADLDDTVAVGDTIHLQWSTDLQFGSITGEATNTLDSSEASAQEAAFAGLSAIASGTHYFRARIEQSDGDYSEWSNIIIHGEAEDATPDAFSFTDVNDVALSTLFESNTVTLSGFNQPVIISVTGGEYAVNTGSGFGSYGSTSGTAYPGYQVKVRHTSSASNSTATNTVLTVGGVSDTYTTTTEAADVSLPPVSGLLLHLDAYDLATLYQTTDGSTTAVAADNDPVGYWGDKSGNGFHLTAASDATRPLYKENSNLPYIVSDGSDDILRRLSVLGLNGNAFTIALSMRTASATAPSGNLSIMGEGSGSSNNPVYIPMATVGGTAQVTTFIRDDNNTQHNVTGNLDGDAFDGNDTVLILTHDGSGSLTLYEDSDTTGVTKTYTPGTLTLNQFSLFAFPRGATGTGAGFIAARIYSLAVWNSVLGSSDLASVRTYMGSKQGRNL